MGLIDDFLFIDIEFEVELPCADGVGHVAFLVSDGQTDLDELCFLNICPDQKIFSLLLRPRPLDVISVDIDAGELGVHGNHVEFLSHLH